MRFLRLLLMLVAGVVDAKYVPPAEGPVPFRRDRLPIDVDAMRGLSRELLLLSWSIPMEKPEDQRIVAKFVALSRALDPANPQVDRRVEDHGSGAAPGISAELRMLGLSRAWQLHSWLESPEAGEDGQALAACLGDLLVAADPEHPRAADRKAKGLELGAWAGWVADLEAFQDLPEEPDPPVITDTESPIALPSASARLVIWQQGRGAGTPARRAESPGFVTISMKARIVKEEPAFALESGDQALRQLLPGIGATIRPILEARHGELPTGLRIGLTPPRGFAPANSTTTGSLAAVTLLLADAALSGNPPRAAVYASLAPDGSFELPPKAWQTLRSLGELPPGRLILPASAAPILPYLVTLDRTEGFLSQEVLLAADGPGLCDLANPAPDSELGEVFAAFENLKNARAGRSPGAYATLPATQAGLNQIVAALPAHASARMLALRGTSKWPTRLEREVFAREIRAAILPLSELMRMPWSEMKAEQIEAVQTTCRDQLEALEKLAGSIGDRDQLLVPAANTVKLLSGLAATVKRAKANEQDRIRVSKLAVFRDYLVTMKLISDAAGDLLDYPLPAANSFR